MREENRKVVAVMLEQHVESCNSCFKESEELVKVKKKSIERYTLKFC